MKNLNNKGTVMFRFKRFFRSMRRTSSSSSDDNDDLTSFEVDSTSPRVEDLVRRVSACDGGETTGGVPWSVRFTSEGSFLTRTCY